MSFDAGSIVGGLGLDISGYTEGMLKAEGISELFPEVVSEFLASPLLGLADVAKESADAVVDAVAEIGNSAASMELAAQKAGTSTQFFSEWVEVGKTVKVGQDQIGIGFKFIQKNAVDAIDGVGAARKGFNDLGISIDFLKEHINDTEALFLAMRSGLNALPDPAERSRRAMELLGREGSEMVPLFNLSDEAISDIIGTAGKFGSLTDEQEGKAGLAFKRLETQVGEAFDGIEKAAAVPILEFLDNHMDEITPHLIDLSDEIRESLNTVFENPQQMQDFLNTAFDLVKNIVDLLPTLATLLSTLLSILDDVLQAVNAVDSAGGSVFGVLESMSTFGLAGPYGLSGLISSAGGSGGTQNYTINMPDVDPDATAQKLGEKIAPKLKAAQQRQQVMVERASQHMNVARGVGGRL